MASLASHYGSFRIVFRFRGQKYGRSLKTDNERQALAKLARVEDNLARLETGQLTLPSGADLAPRSSLGWPFGGAGRAEKRGLQNDWRVAGRVP